MAKSKKMQITLSDEERARIERLMNHPQTPRRALSDKNGLMCRRGTHSFARYEIRSAISTVRLRSSASR